MSTKFKLYNVTEDDLYANKSKEEREILLPKMVKYALTYGNKPAARYFNTYPSTIRKWVNIYKNEGREGLKIK